MNTPAVGHLDPARLAAAVALAFGATTDGPDRPHTTALLERLGALLEASHALLILGPAHDAVVHAAVGCAPEVIGRPASGGPVLPRLGAWVDTMTVALSVRDHHVGTLELARRVGAPFSADDRTLVDLAAARFALLLERHRLQQAEADARAVAERALAALREKEQRIEAMVDGTVALLALLTPDGRMLEVNRSALQLVAATPAQVLDRPFPDTPWWTHDEAQRARLRALITAAASGEPGGFEATHVAADGRRAVVDFSLRPVHGPDGAVTYLVAEGRDVTVRTELHSRLAQSHDELASRLSSQSGELREMQALHRAVVETIVDGVIVIDHQGRIEWTNAAALAMFGYESAALLGRNVSMLMGTVDAAQHDGYLERYLTTGERRVIGIGREVRGRRQDGSDFPLYLAVGETRVDGARKFTGILRDLTDTKRLELMLQERQTLARIGELASVVAHEVRNPLAAIRGVVEVIQTRFASDSPDRKILGDLLVRVDSLDQLVSDLLVYARPTPPVFRRTGMLTLARDTVALIANDRGSGSVHFTVSGEEAALWVDPTQMGRTLLNLLTNAAQAMRDSGVVRITGERLAGRYRLVVADEGPGMPADVVARCLEPFFTTKTRGTGLGLPIAKRIVDEHGGTFTVHAEPGVGTRVTIELPLEDDPAPVP